MAQNGIIVSSQYGGGIIITIITANWSPLTGSTFLLPTHNGILNFDKTSSIVVTREGPEGFTD